MKQKLISLCAVALMFVAQAKAGVALTIPDVNIVPGGIANVVIYFDLGTQAYTAFQFDIAYPEGISSVSDDEGNPSFIKGDAYSDAHNVSSIHTSKGLDRFQCFSVASIPLVAQNGTLLILPIKAQKTLTEGTYQATISPIEFVQTDATPDRPEAITFNITVDKNVVLDETSVVLPVSASGVNVQVKRTIDANEWSTICLPFSMQEAQVKACFGDDVQLCDFTGTETDFDGNDKVVKITVNFDDVKTIAANHPYIINVSQPVTEFSVEGVDIDPNEDDAFVEFDNGKTGSRRVVYSGFYGTYHAGTTLEKYSLFLDENLFWYSMGKTKMKAFRAYFNFLDVLTEIEEAGARVNLRVNNDVTGIREIDARQLKGSDYSSTIVNLAGQHVGLGYKGIVIVNGKKQLKK